MLGGQLMGVARFPGTAANSFRIDSKARPARLRGRAFIEELWDSGLCTDCVLLRGSFAVATRGYFSVSFGTENTTMAPTTAKAANM